MVFKLKVIRQDKLDIYRKIKDKYPEISADKTNIQIKNAKLVLDIMHFLLQEYSHEIKFELTDTSSIIHQVNNIDDYSSVKNYILGLWVKEIQNETNIFDGRLSYDEKRSLLERVNKSSKFYASYEDYLMKIAIEFAEEITSETVNLEEVNIKYIMKEETQSGIPRDAYVKNSVDLRLFPLRILDLKKITELINDIKQN